LLWDSIPSATRRDGTLHGRWCVLRLSALSLLRADAQDEALLFCITKQMPYPFFLILSRGEAASRRTHDRAAAPRQPGLP
jgi:hypothetical protein